MLHNSLVYKNNKKIYVYNNKSVEKTIKEKVLISIYFYIITNNEPLYPSGYI